MSRLVLQNLSNAFNTSMLNNSNSSGSGTVQIDESWGVLKLIQICSYILIAVVGSLGNILTIVVLLKPQNRTKTSSILLLNLAVCDVCIAAIGIPLDLGELIPGNWYYGKALCNVIYPFQTSLPMVSSWTLMFMLAERNMIFSRHITIGLRARAVRFLAMLTWILPLALVVPYGFKLSLEGGACGENWARPVDRQIYTIALFVTEYLVPIISITLFVGNIGSYLRTERKSVRKNALGLDKRTSKRRLRTNIRLTMIFIVIVTLYAALKLPNNVFWLWVEFGGGGDSPHFDTIWTSVGLCSYSTSMTNPFVLGAMSADFRKEFIHILTCRICCRKKPSNTFSPFSSTTIVSYKRINKIGKATIEINGNDKKTTIKTQGTTDGKTKANRSPNWKRTSAIGRGNNRRKSLKYKYADLLPDSGPDSPMESPFRENGFFRKSSPLVDVDSPETDSCQIHLVSIAEDQQWKVQKPALDSANLHSDTMVTSSSEDQSHQSVCMFFPEDSSDEVGLTGESRSSGEGDKCKQIQSSCLSLKKRPDSGVTGLADSSCSTDDFEVSTIESTGFNQSQYQVRYEAVAKGEHYKDTVNFRSAKRRRHSSLNESAGTRRKSLYDQVTPAKITPSCTSDQKKNIDHQIHSNSYPNLACIVKNEFEGTKTNNTASKQTQSAMSKKRKIMDYTIKQLSIQCKLLPKRDKEQMV